MFREREAGVGVERGAEVPVGIGGTVGISVACGAQAGNVNDRIIRKNIIVGRLRAMGILS
jgi:hypothetical protein